MSIGCFPQSNGGLFCAIPSCEQAFTGIWERSLGIKDAELPDDASNQLEESLGAASLRLAKTSTAEVRPDPLLKVLLNPRFSIFGAEDNVIIERCVGVGHGPRLSPDECHG